MNIKSNRYDKKLIILWTIFFLQLILVTSYIIFSPVLSSHFVDIGSNIQFVNNKNVKETKQIVKKIGTVAEKIKLKFQAANDLYFNNSSVGFGCYIEGTDIQHMERNNINSRYESNCICLSMWHGMDCSQPEIIWRALLTSKLKFKIRGPRLKLRRLIYLSKFNALTTTEIVLNELLNVVDLFIIYDANAKSTVDKFMEKGLFKEHRNKILILNNYNSSLNKLWNEIELKISNLRPDDYLIYTNESEILNKKALQYLKLYNYPEPLLFRLKWTVYGFYFQHPVLTNIATCGISINQLRETYFGDLKLMISSLIDTNHLMTSKTLTIGDLNHYGGWFCEYCLESNEILSQVLSNPNLSKDIIKNAKGIIDVSYVEELITTGLYIDSKTYLKKLYKFHDKYYAPSYVTDTSWKYDWLLTNIYSKSDEY